MREDLMIDAETLERWEQLAYYNDAKFHHASNSDFYGTATPDPNKGWYWRIQDSDSGWTGPYATRVLALEALMTFLGDDFGDDHFDERWDEEVARYDAMEDIDPEIALQASDDAKDINYCIECREPLAGQHKPSCSRRNQGYPYIMRSDCDQQYGTGNDTEMQRVTYGPRCVKCGELTGKQHLTGCENRLDVCDVVCGTDCLLPSDDTETQREPWGKIKYSKCRECGRIAGDYHDPTCKLRHEPTGLHVTAFHCRY